MFYNIFKNLMRSNKTHKIELEDGSFVKMSEEAGVYLAAAQMEKLVNNQYSDTENVANTSQSFLDNKFDEKGLRENYFSDGKEHHSDHDWEAQSDGDYYSKSVKRDNLIDMFLHSLKTEIFITTHLYGDTYKGMPQNDKVNQISESILLEDIKDTSFMQRYE